MWNPEAYAKHSDGQLKWARELQATLDLKGHETILDVGCGDDQVHVRMVRLEVVARLNWAHETLLSLPPL